MWQIHTSYTHWGFATIEEYPSMDAMYLAYCMKRDTPELGATYKLVKAVVSPA